jgi:choice-of-anchor B domain-containing protein
MRSLRSSVLFGILPLTLVASATFGQVSREHEEPGGAYAGDFAFDAEAVARLAALTEPAPCVDGHAAEMFACQNVDLVSFVSLPNLRPDGLSVSNLWGFVDADDGREYAVVGVSSGTAVVEVTDAGHPRVVGSVAGPASIWREMKVYQVWNPERGRHDAYAYVVSEAPTAGLQIVDLSDLPGSISLAATFRGFDTAHTVFVANVDPASGVAKVEGVRPVLYVEGSDQGFLALDVTHPLAPTILGHFRHSYVHDIWAGVLRGARAGPCAPDHDPCELVVDWGGDAVRFVDFTSKSNPVIVAAMQYPELAYAHSGWISRDGNYVFSFDEYDEIASGGNSRIRVLDISDLAHPTLAAVFPTSTTAIEHNGYAVGDKLYVSHYERGMTIIDVTVPTAPREIGFFDTFPTGDEAEFHGAWGVFPFLPSGTLLVSNIDGAGGLFVLRESAAAIAPPPDVPRAPVKRIPRPPRGTRRLSGAR